VANTRAGPDLGPRRDMRERANTDAVADNRASLDHRRWMHARRRVDLRRKGAGKAGEGVARAGYENRGFQAQRLPIGLRRQYGDPCPVEPLRELGRGCNRDTAGLCRISRMDGPKH